MWKELTYKKDNYKALADFNTKKFFFLNLIRMLLMLSSAEELH